MKEAELVLSSPEGGNVTHLHKVSVQDFGCRENTWIDTKHMYKVFRLRFQ